MNSSIEHLSTTIDWTFLTFSHRSLSNWVDPKLPIDQEDGVRTVARHKLLRAIYTATARTPDAAILLKNSNELGLKVKQLMNSVMQEYELDDDFAMKTVQCEEIFGKLSIS